MTLLVTCDTAGWRTPNRLRHCLAEAGLMPNADEGSLAFPRAEGLGCGPQPGHDHEAYLAARMIAHQSKATCLLNEFRTDLVDVSKSLSHPRLFQPAARGLPETTRRLLIDEIHTPYRESVRRELSQMLLRYPYVVHLSIRTFPARKRNGDWVRGDVGLRYDPAVSDEVDWCLDLMDELAEQAPQLKVRRNHPGRGTNDSLTRTMREHFDDLHYIGVEMVLNRAWMARAVRRREECLRELGFAVAAVCPSMAEAA